MNRPEPLQGCWPSIQNRKSKIENWYKWDVANKALTRYLVGSQSGVTSCLSVFLQRGAAIAGG
ncbi:MAG: hypothetical protein ACFE0I_05455 [Elainellaceae cyanobacterium]